MKCYMSFTRLIPKPFLNSILTIIPKTIKGRIILGIVLFIAFVFLRKLINSLDYAKHAHDPLIPIVEIIQSESQSQSPTSVLTGVSQAFKSSTLRAEIGGKIIALPTDKGAWVSDKQTLIQIIDNDRAARLKEAESRFKQREAEFRASTDLRAKALKAENSHLATKADFEAAKALLNRIQLEVEHLSIKAPFSGYYDQRLVDIGDFVDIGDPVATVLNLDQLKVVMNVSETDIISIFEGQTATVIFTAYKKKYPAKITYISKNAEPKTRTFSIELTLDNPDKLASGLTCQVTIMKQPIHVHNIPLSALVLNDQGVLGVMTLDQTKKTHFKSINIESMQKETVYATGLTPHVTVVTTGSSFVKAGQTVIVKEKGTL